MSDFASLKLSNGDIIPLPLSLEQITLNQWTNYQLAGAKFEELRALDDSEAIIDLVSARVELMKAIAPTYDWLNCPDILNDNVDDAILQVIDFVNSVHAAYDPETKERKSLTHDSFKIGDEEFICTKERAQGYLNLVPALTANEVCEVAELQDEFYRLTQNATKIQLYEGNYQLNLKQIAVLYRKEGEDLPLDTVKRKAFIAERAAKFKELPATISVDTNFFLQTIFVEHTVDTLPFSSLPQTKGKMKKEQRSQRRAKNNLRKLKAHTE